MKKCEKQAKKAMQFKTFNSASTNTVSTYVTLIIPGVLDLFNVGTLASIYNLMSKVVYSSFFTHPSAFHNCLHFRCSTVLRKKLYV